jgi:hypothetical protein
LVIKLSLALVALIEAGEQHTHTYTFRTTCAADSAKGAHDDAEGMFVDNRSKIAAAAQTFCVSVYQELFHRQISCHVRLVGWLAGYTLLSE